MKLPRGATREERNAYHREYYAQNRGVMLPRKVDQMKARRADPVKAERIRAQQRASHARRKDKAKAYYRNLRENKFFEWRARLFNRNGSRLTADQLRAIWEAQGGRCALTNRPLSPTAQLDHILPVARGGGHGLDNLRWVCREVNLAKRDLTDAEFELLCAEVLQVERSWRLTP